jgi:hypothetical protein
MRTTLTLDPDVAALVRRALKGGDRSLKDVVNDALRRGLQEEQPAARPPYRIAPLPMGGPLVNSLDDVAGILAIAEGDAHR